MTALGRVARLTVQQVDPVTNASAGGWFRRGGYNSTVLEGVRIAFSATRGHRGRPKPAEIKIYNLSEQSRADLQVLPLVALLEAGYASEGLRRVLSGDVRRAPTRREGTALVTTIEVADGDRAWRGASLDRAYRRDVPLVEILRDAARACGLSLPPAVEADPSLRSQLAGGYVASGGALQQLERLLEGYGYEVSIQDGRLQALAAGVPRQGEAITYGPDQLVGAPSLSSKGRLTFRVVLDPRLFPGQLVQVHGREADATGGDVTWIVVSAKLDGDTSGGAWHTTCEARPWRS